MLSTTLSEVINLLKLQEIGCVAAILWPYGEKKLRTHLEQNNLFTLGDVFYSFRPFLIFQFGIMHAI